MNSHGKYLNRLEAEAIYMIREAFVSAKKPVLLFSGGKDSTVLAHLAKKALYPRKMIIPLLHIDTGHNFSETILFRDSFVHDNDFDLIVAKVEDAISAGDIKDNESSRNTLQSFTLLKEVRERKFDIILGGARRDEEKARAKEKFFSFRDSKGGWDPSNQRPEFWDIFNLGRKEGESFRVYPLSNWTEKNIWEYIQVENIRLPSLYFSHPRKVFKREGVLLADEKPAMRKESEESFVESVRFRTIGDITCTAALVSKANTIDRVLEENLILRSSERGTRIDDKLSENAMEERKREGYF